ncbi:MAG TPA: UDP-N-acetylmuramoyl-L-alanyl-D-glutamate--2,6-diaminopimelate ligase [Vulgatibacter sp.]|nr:UDP-N-acetylmuramoyl-L-alanyl-D-glutamate--2,6-diaminopimelate ligase [Vulgatibacter sp.]
MRLSQVIADAGCRGFRGAGDPEIGSITADSRQVRPGSLFVCVAGGRSDGHDFVDAALAGGAAAVIAGRELPWDSAVPLVLTSNTRRALAIAAGNLFGRPDERIALAGVTGTNGKTTVSFLLASILEGAGVRCGLIGTIGVRSGGAGAEALAPATHTTPDAVSLASTLSRMADDGARFAALEVSSHALDQERVAGLRFRAAAFTNLTRDHLDYHGDMDRYFAAKARLFRERLHPGAISVVNHDDPHGRELAGLLSTKVWRFSATDPACEVSASKVVLGHDGIRAEVRTPAGSFPLRSALIGAHNLQNLLGAAGLALALGRSIDEVASGLEAAAGAPGRLERVGPRAFVDYAHTPDALDRVGACLREVAPARLVVVFGCGGDRDAGKRPLMGEAAGRLADLAVVTSDNPRSEDPAAIAAAIEPGLAAAGLERLDRERALAGAGGYVVELDRRAAIDLAVAALGPDDLLLVAGKGHETTQTFADRVVHFDDREEVRRALEGR